MCHLATLKMFKKPLPAKGNFAHIWEKITKGEGSTLKLLLLISSIHIQ